MTTHRFFVPDLDPASTQAALSRDQSHQASRVLRLRPGDPIILFDGQGNEFQATLAELETDQWTVDITAVSQPQREPPVHLTLGLSLIRNERFDMAVQKLTELGIAGIVPVLAGRSVISYRDDRAWQKRRARIERVIVEAAEQSERVTLPTLFDPLSVQGFINQHGGESTYALVERSDAPRIADAGPPAGDLSILVGPEGGWTEDEIQMIDQHAEALSMGNLILRSETAAIAAASYFLLSAQPSEQNRS